MGRLTKYFADGDECGYELCHGGCESCDGVLCDNALEMIKKLAHYEDMEEQGRLIELPCALYDVVWSIGTENLLSYKIIRSDSIGSFAYSEEGLEMWDWNGVWIGTFGKTAFLTKEEAEAKLKELEGEKE